MRDGLSIEVRPDKKCALQVTMQAEGVQMTALVEPDSLHRMLNFVDNYRRVSPEAKRCEGTPPPPVMADLLVLRHDVDPES